MRATAPVSLHPSRSLPARKAPAHCLECGLRRCPVLTLTIAMILTGVGMVLAVSVATLVCVLPLGLLLGWL